MNTEFQKALDKRRILKFPQGKKLIKKKLTQAIDDLDEAIDRFKNKKYKYAARMRIIMENFQKKAPRQCLKMSPCS
ncbi:MAG: hypothetical protein KAI70_05245 [Candidatus Omnitrophica bacterium]|nr:hypothetical protein [Candidatus Omnitrophota bacterium]